MYGKIKYKDRYKQIHARLIILVLEYKAPYISHSKYGHSSLTGAIILATNAISVKFCHCFCVSYLHIKETGPNKMEITA
jgi:hypothetical protein